MNVPHVKQFGVDGKVSNPINGKLLNKFPNRRQRRMKDARLKCGRMIVQYLGKGRFSKLIESHQIEFDKEGKKKLIVHWS